MPSKPILGLCFCILLSLQNALSKSNDSISAQLDISIISEEQIKLKLILAEEKQKTDIKGAIVCARQALSDAEKINSPRWIAESKLAIGKFYDNLGVNSEALEHLRDALEIFKEIGDQDKRIATLRLIGNSYYYLNEFKLAKGFYSEVLKYGWEENDTSLIIDGLINMGAVYGNIGEMDSALNMFYQSFELAKETGLVEKEIHSLYYIGDVFLYSDSVSKALELFNEIVENYDVAASNPRNYAGVLNSLTMAYTKSGNLNKAEEYSKQTKVALDKFPRETQTGIYLYNKYRIDSIKGDFAGALTYYIKYRENRKKIEDKTFKEHLANFEIVYELEKKENRIKTLTLDNQVKDLKIRQRKLINLGSLFLIILLLIIIWQAFLAKKKVNEKNLILEEQKKALKAANEKISSQSIRLHDRNRELEDLIEELKTTQQQLVQAEKMASLGTLTAGIAHEINNPLNFIAGGMEIISDIQNEIIDELNKEQETNYEKAKKIIQEGIDRASKIVGSLVTFSYSGEPKLSNYKVTDIIDSTLLFLNSKLSPDINVLKDFTFTGESLIYPDKLHQVFLNILDNAIFAVLENSNINKQISVSCNREKDEIVMVFSNNGPQINNKVITKIFDPFFTTKDPGMGSGLGLAISYKLISEHNGDIIAQNNESGVSFIIRIPYLT